MSYILFYFYLFTIQSIKVYLYLFIYLYLLELILNNINNNKYIGYKLFFSEKMIDQTIYYLVKKMGLKYFNSKLLKRIKFFWLIWFFGNFISSFSFISSYNCDWEILFIWSFALCFFVYLYFFIIFSINTVSRWIINFSQYSTTGISIIFLFIELLSLSIRTFSLTSRFVINSFSGSIYIIILSYLVFTFNFNDYNLLNNFFGYIFIIYLIIFILFELIKISFQALLYIILAIYYLAALEQNI